MTQPLAIGNAEGNIFYSDDSGQRRYRTICRRSRVQDSYVAGVALVSGISGLEMYHRR